MALDALTLLPGRPGSELLDASRFASRALGLGILANLGSAATGVTDWQHTHEEDRRIGLVHGVLNAIATALYGLSWWHRRGGNHIRGIAISALGYGITAAPAIWVARWCSSQVSEIDQSVRGCAPESGSRCCP